jgi:primary-amine oxidase
LVVWHSFGHTHFCKPEDLPVMPVEYAGFTLKPNNFFGRNPGIDVAPGKDGHSTSKGSCCPE